MEQVEGIPEFEFVQETGNDILKRIEHLLKEETKKGELTEEYFARYRQNLQELESVKEDIRRLEDLLMQAGIRPKITIVREEEEKRLTKESRGKPAVAGVRGLKLLAGSIFEGKIPDRVTTWKIIYIIIGFLGFISLVFFLVWVGQVQKEKKRKLYKDKNENEGEY